MKRQYIVLILFLLAGVSICAQQKTLDRNFYYYNGEKFYIQADYSRISIATEGSISADKINNTIKEAPVKIMNSGKIYEEKNSIKDKENSFGRNADVFVTEIEFPEKQRENAYFDMIQSIKEDENVVQVTPSFQVNGQRMGLSNNFYVKLLKAEDKQRLYDMADAYSIRVLGSNGFMPLWFTLSCTKDSPCNSIEAANLFHESQLFECAEPEFYITTYHCSYQAIHIMGINGV